MNPLQQSYTKETTVPLQSQAARTSEAFRQLLVYTFAKVVVPQLASPEFGSMNSRYQVVFFYILQRLLPFPQTFFSTARADLVLDPRDQELRGQGGN